MFSNIPISFFPERTDSFALKHEQEYLKQTEDYLYWFLFTNTNDDDNGTTVLLL